MTSSASLLSGLLAPPTKTSAGAAKATPIDTDDRKGGDFAAFLSKVADSDHSDEAEAPTETKATRAKDAKQDESGVGQPGNSAAGFDPVAYLNLLLPASAPREGTAASTASAVATGSNPSDEPMPAAVADLSGLSLATVLSSRTHFAPTQPGAAAANDRAAADDAKGSASAGVGARSPDAVQASTEAASTTAPPGSGRLPAAPMAFTDTDSAAVTDATAASIVPRAAPVTEAKPSTIAPSPGRGRETSVAAVALPPTADGLSNGVSSMPGSPSAAAADSTRVAAGASLSVPKTATNAGGTAAPVPAGGSRPSTKSGLASGPARSAASTQRAADNRPDSDADATSADSASPVSFAAPAEGMHSDGPAKPPVVEASARVVAGDAATAGLSSIIAQITSAVADAAPASDRPSNGSSGTSTPENPVATASTAPLRTLDLQLNPANLGSMTLSMRMSNGTLELRMTVSRPETLAALSRDQDSLSKSLTGLGYVVGDLRIAQSGGVDSKTLANPGQQASAQPGGQEASSGFSGQGSGSSSGSDNRQWSPSPAKGTANDASQAGGGDLYV